MADVVKTKGEIKWELQFSDGDTRTISLENPRVDLTLADLTTAMASIGTVFSGDVAGAPYSSFTDARKVATTTRYLDLTD